MSYALVKLVKPVSASCFIRETISNGSRIREGEFKIRQDIFLNVMTFVWSVRFRTQIVRNRTGLNEGKNS